MKLSRHAVIASLLLAVSAGTAHAALPAIISGYVTSGSTGKPVTGAKVWVKGGVSVKTKANGAYVLTIPAGNITVCSAYSGYTSTCTSRFNISSGQTKNLNFTLKPGK